MPLQSISINSSRNRSIFLGHARCRGSCWGMPLPRSMSYSTPALSLCLVTRYAIYNAIPSFVGGKVPASSVASAMASAPPLRACPRAAAHAANLRALRTAVAGYTVLSIVFQVRCAVQSGLLGLVGGWIFFREAAALPAAGARCFLRPGQPFRLVRFLRFQPPQQYQYANGGAGALGSSPSSFPRALCCLRVRGSCSVNRLSRPLFASIGFQG